MPLRGTLNFDINRPKFNPAALGRYGIYRGLRNQAIKSYDNDFNFLTKIANTFRRKFMPDQVCGYVLFRAHIRSSASRKNNCASRENFINSARINSWHRLNFKISAATKSARIVRLVSYEL